MTKTQVGVCVASAVVLVALAYPPVNALVHRERNHGELRALSDALSIGMSRSEVALIWSGGAYPHLKLTTPLKERWIVWAPSDFGYMSWCLFIEFNGDRVIAVRIRDGDALAHHPGDAPPDKASAR